MQVIYKFILFGNCLLIWKATYCHMEGCFLLFIDLQAAIILVLLGYPLLRIFLFQYYIGSTECGKKHPTPKTHLSRKEAETIKPSNQHHFYILLCLGCGVFINKTFLLYSMIYHHQQNLYFKILHYNQLAMIHKYYFHFCIGLFSLFFLYNIQ